MSRGSWRLSECRELGSEIKRILVLSAGGSLNVKQRSEVETHLGKLRTAVLTDSMVTRGAVTALKWFKVPIAAFAPNQIERAMDHIGVPKDERTAVLKTLEQAKARLL